MRDDVRAAEPRSAWDGKLRPGPGARDRLPHPPGGDGVGWGLLPTLDKTPKAEGEVGDGGTGREKPFPWGEPGRRWAARPHPPPGAHPGVLGNVDGVEHRVVLHRQAQVRDGAAFVPLHQDVFRFQISVRDRWLACVQEGKALSILVTAVWILM